MLGNWVRDVAGKGSAVRDLSTLFSPGWNDPTPRIIPVQQNQNLSSEADIPQAQTPPFSHSAGLTVPGIPVKWWANDIPEEK
jgi:phosphatidylserine/phosphatidylglycerophosphate/cardiolipin synthase-like enzyme